MPGQKPKIKGVADLVVCLDVTASMQPCIDKLKANLDRFVSELEKPREDGGQEFALKDWRIRLIPFRDLDCGEPIVTKFPFVKSKAEFRAQLDDPETQASGGGDAPESALDAMFVAAKSDWRNEKEAHRFVLLFSDAPTKAKLHASTAGDGPADLSAVIEELRRRRVKPIILAPQQDEYKNISNMRIELKDKVPSFSSSSEVVSYFNSDISFQNLLDRIAATLSASSSEVL